MKIFVLTLLVGCGLISAFIYRMDPAGRWHGVIASDIGTPTEGEGWIFPQLEMNDRVIKNRLLEVWPIPRRIYLGSSRVLFADSTMGEKKALNLGVIGASSEDYIAYWQLIKEARKIPKEIFIFIDPWVFNANSPQHKWKTNFAPYDRFMIRAKKGYFDASWKLLRLAIEKWVISWNEGTGLFSWENAEAALKNFRASDWHFPNHEQITSATLLREVQPSQKAIRWDGSIIYPYSEYDPHTTSEKVRRSAIRFANTQPFYSFDDWRTDEGTQDRLRLLFQDILREGVLLKVILPPLHPAAWDIVKGSETNFSIFKIYVKKLEDLTSEFTTPSLKMCNFVDPSTLNCGEEHFMDAIHALPDCVRKELERCVP